MSSFNDPIARKKALIEAAKARSVKPEDGVLAKTAEKPKEYIKPEDAENKLRIVFDNSGSMSRYLNGVSSTKIKEAKKGVVEFLRNCSLNKDAVAVHLLNSQYYGESWNEYDGTSLSILISNSELTTDLVRLASAVDSESVNASGGTPLYSTIKTALTAQPQASRLIAFSDGQPDTQSGEAEVINIAKELKIPIDTVYFGEARSSGADVMFSLAEATGGIYLAFDPAKGVNFAQAFKYLSPGKRLMLMNAEFKAKLERGEIK